MFSVGDNTEGVMHNFQYHANYMKTHIVSLSYFDKFYQKTSAPMNLMNIEDF